MSEIIGSIGDKVQELLSELGGGKVFGTDAFAISQYTIWMIIAAIVLLIIVFAAKKRLSMVPTNRFANGVEYVVDWVRTDICQGVIGHGSEKYTPFLLTLFFFILINNLIGLIPGCKPGTGTIGVTFALALISWIYFNYQGMKKQGVLHYIGSFAPKGIFFLVSGLIWVIEIFSLILRCITLAIRLFANMYSGHIVMGTFCILITMFVTPLITQFTAANFAMALPSIGWMLLLLMMYAVELLVAVIQSYVFTLLSAVYISLAVPAEGSGH